MLPCLPYSGCVANRDYAAYPKHSKKRHANCSKCAARIRRMFRSGLNGPVGCVPNLMRESPNPANLKGAQRSEAPNSSLDGSAHFHGEGWRRPTRRKWESLDSPDSSNGAESGRKIPYRRVWRCIEAKPHHCACAFRRREWKLSVQTRQYCPGNDP